MYAGTNGLEGKAVGVNLNKHIILVAIPDDGLFGQ